MTSAVTKYGLNVLQKRNATLNPSFVASRSGPTSIGSVLYSCYMYHSRVPQTQRRRNRTNQTIHMLELHYNFQRSYILFITIIFDNIMLCLCALQLKWMWHFEFCPVHLVNASSAQFHDCDMITSHISTESPHVFQPFAINVIVPMHESILLSSHD